MPTVAVGEKKAEVIEDVLERLVLLEHGRQALVDSLWARIPSYVVEAGYQAAVTSLTVNPQTTKLERINAVIASLPSGATGLLQLGDVIVPLGQGITNMGGVGFLLNTTSTRSLTSTVSGPLALVLFGEVLPTDGVLT